MALWETAASPVALPFFNFFLLIVCLIYILYYTKLYTIYTIDSSILFIFSKNATKSQLSHLLKRGTTGFANKRTKQTTNKQTDGLGYDTQSQRS